MQAGALRALEFERIVSVVTSLALTPPGRDRLVALHPQTHPAAVNALQGGTTEGTRFLTHHADLPLRAPSDLGEILDALTVERRGLEALRLLGLAQYLESLGRSRDAIHAVADSFPVLGRLVESLPSFRQEIADVHRKIEPSGDVADDASSALANIRERLRRQKARLRSTLDSFLRSRETAKYLQEHVVTDRNGRYVLMVRSEHRSAIPGIVHGGSASGASLFVEPMETVDINNDIVALEDQDAEEVRRILLALTDAFRARPSDMRHSVDVATELDAIQARARFSAMIDGVEPLLSTDGTVELRGARHPLLMRRVNEQLEARSSDAIEPVPVDIHLIPPTRVLVITGPNTGGKTVALKTAGLLAAMAQAGLHIPAEPGSRLPVFRSLFADIGDEQSISASLSTFSAHITNVVSMDRELTLPALVLLDEVGAGTDPVEGGALAIALIDRFRSRGAHLVATTHYDALKSYASATDGVASAAFGFDPDTFAPTYRLIYGSPGRSLALEIAARLGMPPAVIATARQNLSDREKQLAEHLARVDQQLQALEQERRAVARERAAVGEVGRTLQAREHAVREREAAFRRRLDTRLDEHLREARRAIDAVVDGLKSRAAELSAQAARRASSGIHTGEAGAIRTEARAAVDQVVDRIRQASVDSSLPAPAPTGETGTLAPGVRVAVGALGLEGVIIAVHDHHAEVDVRGKRLRAARRDLRVIGGTPPASTVHVRVDLKPREGPLTELNVIGCTVDQAIERTERFLDDSTVTDARVVRVIHGHGTGQLRRALTAFLEVHPLVAHIAPAPPDQGGGGATIVELKD